MNGLIVNSAICVAAIVYRGWFIRSLSQDRFRKSTSGLGKQIQKAKIETQRGIEPWRNMARSKNMARAAQRVAPEAAIASNSRNAKGNMAERFRGLTTVDLKRRREREGKATNNCYGFPFVREGDRFKT